MNSGLAEPAASLPPQRSLPVVPACNRKAGLQRAKKSQGQMGNGSSQAHHADTIPEMHTGLEPWAQARPSVPAAGKCFSTRLREGILDYGILDYGLALTARPESLKFPQEKLSLTSQMTGGESQRLLKNEDSSEFSRAKRHDVIFILTKPLELRVRLEAVPTPCASNIRRPMDQRLVARNQTAALLRVTRSVSRLRLPMPGLSCSKPLSRAVWGPRLGILLCLAPTNKVSYRVFPMNEDTRKSKVWGIFFFSFYFI